MNKNETYQVTIEDIGSDGEGIGHIYAESPDADSKKGITVFVKDTVVGDVVRVKIIKVKKNYVYARLMDILMPSPDRVEALCSKARSCGGCSIMHMSYEKQLAYKFNKVKNCLERIGGLADAERLMEPVYGMTCPYHYRNKMQFPVGVDSDGNVKIGFYAGRTHSIVDLDACATGHRVNTCLIKNLREWIGKNFSQDPGFVYREEQHTGLLRHIVTRVGYATGELSVCLVINGEGLGRDPVKDRERKEELICVVMRAVEEYNLRCNRLREGDIGPDQGKNCSDDKKVALKNLSLNINREKTNRILGDQTITIFGEEYITDMIGDIRFHVSPQSFFQVNPVQTKVLYEKALSYAALTGNEIVWDMYCGIGTISLFLAQKAKKVYGVEIVPQAIQDAKKNAKLNHLSNTEFYCGKAEEIVPKLYREEGIKPDVIVVDPPRKGCDPLLLDTIAAMSPERLVYVSCDPATLARDVKILVGKGFQVERVAVVDQFCHSVHVEIVVSLST
ncbi:MAG: 23S rRNA (uracil(1939)-C(5))-methyltransferase RlmD [Lachnospiraceae bacterium]|nr:23S rRNA (uracil(1939)-C(5))-methyltransferase RlmD [Lachnospiraceae bacterium]